MLALNVLLTAFVVMGWIGLCFILIFIIWGLIGLYQEKKEKENICKGVKGLHEVEK